MQTWVWWRWIPQLRRMNHYGNWNSAAGRLSWAATSWSEYLTFKRFKRWMQNKIWKMKIEYEKRKIYLHLINITDWSHPNASMSDLQNWCYNQEKSYFSSKMSYYKLQSFWSHCTWVNYNSQDNYESEWLFSGRKYSYKWYISTHELITQSIIKKLQRDSSALMSISLISIALNTAKQLSTNTGE